MANRIDSLRHRVMNVVDAATVRADELRARSTIVDRAFGVLNRERLIATSVLSAFVAFRVFVFMVPLAYVVVAGLGLYGSFGTGGTQGVVESASISEVVASSVATAVEASDQGRWVALTVGSVALLWASVGVTKSLHAVHLVAWRLPRGRVKTTIGAVVGPVIMVTVAIGATTAAAVIRNVNPVWGLAATAGLLIIYAAIWLLASILLPREPGSPWTVLLPGAALLAIGLEALHIAVVFYFGPRVGRASEAYGALGVALVVLAWLFLLGRLGVAAAELNASLWEQRLLRRAESQHHLRIDPDGRIALPRELRKEWGVDAGDQVVVEREGKWMRLSPVRTPGSSPSAPPAHRR